MAWRKLEDTFYDSWKFSRLARHLSVDRAKAAGHIAFLWSWALRHAPDGDLSRFDDEDIEYAVGWNGQRGDFIAACVASGLIDEVVPEMSGTVQDSFDAVQDNADNVQNNADTFTRSCKSTGDQRKIHQLESTRSSKKTRATNAKYVIHNWFQRGGSYAESQRKRLSREIERSAKSMSENVQDSPGNVPDSPGNVRSRKEKKRKEYTCDSCAEPATKLKLVDGAKSDNRTPVDASVDLVWQHYREYHPKAAKRLKSGRKEYRLIKQRLEDFEVDDLKLAIDGYHRSAFHNGQNDRGKRYLSLELMLRDVSHVQAGLELADTGSGDRANRLLDTQLANGNTE